MTASTIPEQRGAAALLERERELERFARHLDEAQSDRGGLLVVEGSAGIGKTRLLEAGRTAAAERGMTVLAARASELDREFPFGVVRQLFEQILARADEQERARLLDGAAGLAAALFGGSATLEAPAPSDRSLMLFHALYWLTANLAERGPMLMVVDDLHWADASSLRFLQFLLPRLRELPVLVAVGTRPAESAEPELIDALVTDALSDTVRPSPLSAGAVRVLVDDAFDDDPDPSFCDACHEVTSGNPLLVRELLRELSADGVAPERESAALVRQLAPATVARAVLLRLGRLGDDASKLARAVAVLGDGVPLRRACALAGVAEEDGRQLAYRLAQADIFGALRPISFAHPILRAAVYGELDPGERADAHRRASELLAAEGVDVDAVAVHLLATEPSGDAEVVRTLRAAARWALDRGATRTAVACLRRALDEPPPVAERPRLVLELASAELRAGDAAAASDHFEEAAGTASDPRLYARFAWDHAVALQALGRQDEAFRVRERAVDAVRDLDAELALSLEASIAATARLEMRRRGWVRERLDRYLAQPALPARAEQRMRVTRAHMDAFARESQESADALADIAEHALASGELVDGPIAVTTPFFAAIELLLLADRNDRARRALDEVVSEAQRRGSAPAFAFASGWRCLLFARAGSLADAEADARNCAELSLSQGWHRLSPILGYVLDPLIDRGEHDEAQRLLERSGIERRATPDDLLFYPLIHARARLRAAAGDLTGSRRDLASLDRDDTRWNTYPTLLPPVLVAPELAAAEPEREREAAERMLREAHVWNTPRAIGVALRANALLADGTRRVELLEQAARTLEGSPARLEHARALADLGVALRVSNRRAAAREPLRQALDVAAAIGATALAERARRELRGAGGRPRRPRVSGADALTASERRIATMAASGRSNPEIAQALFVTKKTVEAHLASAFRKLDIHSRTQLERALRARSS